MTLRIQEYKRDEEGISRMAKLHDLMIPLSPNRVEERVINKVSLEEFLDWVEVTMNMHPLYAFYRVHRVNHSRTRADITIESKRKLSDKPGDVELIFNEKVEKILQSDSPSLDIAEGLKDVNLLKEIKLDYTTNMTIYIECDIIRPTIVGGNNRNIIKTIQIERQKGSKISFSKHFPYMQFHDCEKVNDVKNIRIKLTDKAGKIINFKNGATALTLRCERKSVFD